MGICCCSPALDKETKIQITLWEYFASLAYVFNLHVDLSRASYRDEACRL